MLCVIRANNILTTKSKTPNSNQPAAEATSATYKDQAQSKKFGPTKHSAIQGSIPRSII